MKERMLVLENGSVFYGEGFGSAETAVAEIVFNTSMVGYQEIVSDPAYCGQMIVMSYPLIGNYGVTDEDSESKTMAVKGLIVREYNDAPSNFRFTQTLGEVLKENHVAGITGVDTREIVRILREGGPMKAMITDAARKPEECIKELKAAKLPKDQIQQVTSKKIWYARTRNPRFNVAAVDLGMTLGTIRILNAHGCNVMVVPYGTAKEEIDRFKPDGLLISNGPGNPEDAKAAIELVRQYKGEIPILGIGLGCEAIALAYGAKTVKMKVGHRGSNHPVRNLQTGKLEFNIQNHSYATVQKSLDATGLDVTHINLIDGVIEGIADYANGVLGSEYLPDPQTAPAENGDLFAIFNATMEKFGGTENAEKNRY